VCSIPRFFLPIQIDSALKQLLKAHRELSLFAQAPAWRSVVLMRPQAFRQSMCKNVHPACTVKQWFYLLLEPQNNNPVQNGQLCRLKSALQARLVVLNFQTLQG